MSAKENEKPPINGVRITRPALAPDLFADLRNYVEDVGRSLGNDLANLSYMRSFWYQLKASPRNPIEQAIQSLRDIAKPGDKCVGCEWWLNFFSNDRLLEPHFDWDKSRSQREGKKLHPIFGSILYLRDTGSPTVIFDVRPEDLKKDNECWLKAPRTVVEPEENKYVVFEGTLYHGVIPLGKSESPAEKSRITLLVGWWDHKAEPPVCDDLKIDTKTDLKERLEILKTELDRKK